MMAIFKELFNKYINIFFIYINTLRFIFKICCLVSYLDESKLSKIFRIHIFFLIILIVSNV